MILRTITRNLLRSNRTIVPAKPIDYAVCIDIECTCDSPVQIHPMEVIEIACLKLDIRSLQHIEHNTKGTFEEINQSSLSSTEQNHRNQNRIQTNLKHCPSFHSFVKPVINSELTLFCQELTGVTQSTVDRSDPIEKVIDQLFVWLKEQQLIDDKENQRHNFAFASCGNFDLSLLSPIIRRYKFNNNNVELPIYFREWINVKKTFVNHKKEWPKGLYHMLEILGEQPSGRLHSAIDDCKNLARIVECLHSDGCKFHITSRVS